MLLHDKLLDCSRQFNSVAAASSSGWAFCFGLLIRLISSKGIQSTAGDGAQLSCLRGDVMP